MGDKVSLTPSTLIYDTVLYRGDNVIGLSLHMSVSVDISIIYV